MGVTEESAFTRFNLNRQGLPRPSYCLGYEFLLSREKTMMTNIRESILLISDRLILVQRVRKSS